MRWDIFCHVIDNYGDAGVCWRLARQLTAEFDITVRLLVDDLCVLQKICPEVDSNLAIQSIQNIQVLHWIEPFSELVPAEVVIEAFGCELPVSYVTAMAANVKNKTETRWVNLEYLSAEPWVADWHKLPSPHPYLPLIKYFFFPGFTAATGGLIREADLFAQRDTLQSDRTRLWCELAILEPTTDETIVSLFCYDHAPIRCLLEAWSTSISPIHCLLPQDGAVAQEVAEWAGKSYLAVGEYAQRGNLTVQVIPFLSQENYDRLLWMCDCNFVRGEDSFVRAQWAARPVIWQIYPQQEKAHLSKLEAFLNLYCYGLEEAPAEVLRTLYRGWNSDKQLDWDKFWTYRETFQQHAIAWMEQLARIPDLATNLVNFCQDR